jgi:hypothetical protein
VTCHTPGSAQIGRNRSKVGSEIRRRFFGLTPTFCRRRSMISLRRSAKNGSFGSQSLFGSTVRLTISLSSGV